MKYKLIKEYPGSPELRTIVKLKNNGGYELENSTSYFMTKDKVEDYPEFWQPIVEKDYEILEIKGKYGAISSFIEALDSDLKDKVIFKIKRLSDGEIFTIGDFVNGRTISSFSINWISVGFKIHCDGVGKGNINDGCFF